MNKIDIDWRRGGEMTGFTIVTSEQRRALAALCRPYRAHRVWVEDRKTGMMVEANHPPFLPGHRLSNGDWLVPTDCLPLVQGAPQ